MQAWTTYRSLTAEQKAILSEKKLDLQRPVDELLAILKPLAACDTVANKAQGRMGCTLALMILATLIAIVVILGATIASGVFYGWLRGIDVSDNLRKFTVPVLALFREDFDPKFPVHLRLDLSPPTHKTKKTGEYDLQPQGRYYKIIDTTYVDPWMSADAVLTDGTKISWSVTDRIRERRKTKKNPRGKIKSKTKYRKVSDLEVKVALRTKSYALEDAELSADGKRSKVEVQRSVRSDSLDPISPRALVDAITGVYRSARPAKKEANA